MCLTVLEPNGVKTMTAQATVSSLTVTWDKPVGTVTKYKIELKDISNTQQTRTNRNIVFSHLMAGKLYIVIVIALINGLQSEPLETVFYTRKCDLIKLLYTKGISTRDGITATILLGWHKIESGLILTLRNATITRYWNRSQNVGKESKMSKILPVLSRNHYII